MSEVPGTHVYIEPLDVPLALFQLADVIKAMAWAADNFDRTSHQERLYCSASVYAGSSPRDSLSNVLMRYLMEPFVKSDQDPSKAVRDRFKVIDGGVK